MLAPAKINLDLRITGRRDDGYHLLDSVVVFTKLGDVLYGRKSDGLSLSISGPFAGALNGKDDNLILDAARLLCEKFDVAPNIHFDLVKNLPIASGIGGGSSDAAAALKLTQDICQLSIDETTLYDIAMQLGADVPVCLRGKTCHMSGIGEQIREIDFTPSNSILLVNPGVQVSTPAIFKAYHASKTPFNESRDVDFDHIHGPFMLDLLKDSENALEAHACDLESDIAMVLTELSTLEGVMLSRMSGSGATCFAVFENPQACERAADRLIARHKNWWIVPTQLV